MAANKAGFVSGANAKIKMGGKTVAFCSDVSYTADMMTIPIEVIGSYEVRSYEPIAYTVNGSFSIIRYTSNITPGGGNPLGNGPTQIGGNGSGTGGKINQMMNPGVVLSSETFDLEIQQSKAAEAGSTEATAAYAFLKITDVRVTRRQGSLNKRSVMTDTYTFVGSLLMDLDSTETEFTTGSTIADNS
jgi:hypothetical protein